MERTDFYHLSLELPWLNASNWERRASEKALQYSSPNLAPKKNIVDGHGTLKINGWFRCISYWNSHLLGDMLVFGVQVLLSIEFYWLFNRDPKNGLLESLYNWVIPYIP